MELKRSTKIIIISTIILDLFMCLSLFVLYGPWSVFRNFWITTAMTTMNHKYLAYWFYSDETIAEVLANNVIIESDEDTDITLINNDITIDEDIKEYEDIYEEQILNRNNDDSYKLIDIAGSGYKGFLVAVYDPSKIELAMTRYLGVRGETLDVLAKTNNAQVAINAGGFDDPEGKGKGGVPMYGVIKDGKLIYNTPGGRRSGGIIGFDKNNNLILTKDHPQTALTKYNLIDAVEFGPFLIVNGKPSFIKGNGGWGIAPRTVIGQREDGIVLFLIIDGRQPGYSIGANMVQITEIMMNYKAINAANLDGGASTALIVNDKVVNKTASIGNYGLRYLPNAWIVTK